MPPELSQFPTQRGNASMKPARAMAKIEQKVRNILLESFDDDELQLEMNENGLLAGFIISSQFDDLDDLTRQKRIWSLLRKKITKSDRDEILGFIAFTPAEYEAYSEPSL